MKTQLRKLMKPKASSLKKKITITLKVLGPCFDSPILFSDSDFIIRLILTTRNRRHSIFKPWVFEATIWEFKGYFSRVLISHGKMNYLEIRSKNRRLIISSGIKLFSYCFWQVCRVTNVNTYAFICIKTDLELWKNRRYFKKLI